MKRNVFPGALLLVLTACSFPVVADSNLGKELAYIVFTEAERQVMERYFDEARGGQQEAGGTETKAGMNKKKKKNKKDEKRAGLPPGLAKRDQLPSGLAKRAVLPPGLARQPLPRELDQQLPPLREGLERAVVEGSVVLIERATGTVLDILENVAGAN